MSDIEERNNIREIKNIGKNTTIFQSTWIAFKGYLRIFGKEINIRVLTMMTFFAIIVSFVLDLSFIEGAFLTFLWLFTLILEINNTTFEEDIDYTGEGGEFHPEIKKVKDYAASMVLLSSTFAIIVSLTFIIRSLIA